MKKTLLAILLATSLVSCSGMNIDQTRTIIAVAEIEGSSKVAVERHARLVKDLQSYKHLFSQIERDIIKRELDKIEAFKAEIDASKTSLDKVLITTYLIDNYAELRYSYESILDIVRMKLSHYSPQTRLDVMAQIRDAKRIDRSIQVLLEQGDQENKALSGVIEFLFTASRIAYATL